MFLLSLAELGTDLANELIALSSLKLLTIKEGFSALFCHLVLFKSRAAESLEPRFVGSGLPVDQWFSNLIMHWNILEGLLEHRVLNPTLRASDSVGLGWGWSIFIASKIPDGFTAAVGALV